MWRPPLGHSQTRHEMHWMWCQMPWEVPRPPKCWLFAEWVFHDNWSVVLIHTFWFCVYAQQYLEMRARSHKISEGMLMLLNWESSQKLYGKHTVSFTFVLGICQMLLGIYKIMLANITELFTFHCLWQYLKQFIIWSKPSLFDLTRNTKNVKGNTKKNFLLLTVVILMCYILDKNMEQ